MKKKTITLKQENFFKINLSKKKFLIFEKNFFHLCCLKVPAHKCPMPKHSRIKLVLQNGLTLLAKL